MDTIFKNSSKTSKTSDAHRLLPNLSGKIDLKKVINTMLYQILAFPIHGKRQKYNTKIINLKYQLRHRMKSLNYKTDNILYQIF